ncbi:MAG: DNA polymerase III subunit beta [Rhodospirillaceae bacterium]|nr:MAG: DNA polymerase III subunit beta [Rhodospirillaceae bacterium]
MTPSQISHAVQIACDIAKPGIIPILGHVVIANGTIMATDIESEVTIKLPFDIPSVAIPSAKLRSILASIPDDVPVAFSHKDNKLAVKSGRSKMSINTLSSEGMPVMTLEGHEGDFTINASLLKTMLKNVQHAMLNGGARPMLQGVLLHFSDNMLYVVACDGARLAMDKSPVTFKDYQLILPRHSVARLIKMLDDSECTVSIYEGKAKFKFGDVEYTTKLLAEKYPPYERIIPVCAHSILIDRELFIEAINRASIVLDKVRSAKLAIGKVARVTCTNAGEESFDEFDCGATDALEIGINPDFVREALNAAGGDEVTIGYSTSKTPLVVSCGDFVAVIMGLRD